ncbi:YcaO-like family protein [Klenkia sp. LSe6-5]|uniref:YcaO-like family protein n=1 Tax=Klenkia sesuvii TaxID=3103137 RepID=A0ABU8DXM5_9ACTN
MTDPSAAYRSALPTGWTTELDLRPYDRTGVPVTATVWRSTDGTRSGHGVGYGASVGAAATGAWGELAEQVLLDDALLHVEPRTATHAELVRERGVDRVADPLTLVLPAGADPDRPLRWLPTTRWATGEEVLVPAEFVAPHAGGIAAPPPGGGWLVTPITNGMGAGDTLERAVAHGIGELLQRDGDTVDFRALDTGRVITGIDDPQTATLLAELAAAGLEVLVKLDSTEFAVVVHAVARDAAADPPVVLSAIGEAAAPDRAEAVRKAVLELASSRARRAFAFGPLDRVRELHPGYLAAELAAPLGPQEPRALAAMTSWADLTTPELDDLLAPLWRCSSPVPYAELPTSDAAGPADTLALYRDRLAGFDLLVAPARAGDVHVAKVLVPGLEVETLSYGRIGERVARRLLDRGSPLVGRGPAEGPHRRQVRLTADATERLGGPVWLDVAAVDRTVGRLYPLYREPTRHAPERLR